MNTNKCERKHHKRRLR